MVLTLDEFLKDNKPDKPNKDISIKANVYIYNSEDDYIQGKSALGSLDNINFPRNLSRMRNFLNKKYQKPVYLAVGYSNIQKFGLLNLQYLNTTANAIARFEKQVGHKLSIDALNKLISYPRLQSARLDKYKNRHTRLNTSKFYPMLYNAVKTDSTHVKLPLKVSDTMTTNFELVLQNNYLEFSAVL